MIQRIQTLYIVLAMGCSALLYFIPVWNPMPDTDFIGQWPFGISASTHVYLLILLIIMGVAQLLSLLLFMNQKAQGYMVFICRLLALLYFGLGIMITWSQREGFAGLDFKEIGWGNLIPFVVVILLYIAGQKIKGDEALLEDMDRMR